MSEGALGTRMKEYYENRYRIYLTRRTPVILRLDGKSFHTLTKKFAKPYDHTFIYDMIVTASYLCSEIQGCKLGYHQSDEISLLLTDFDELDTDAWFDYNLQKMVSVASGMASGYLSERMTKRAIFDCRAFNVPKGSEVYNYFLWRIRDWNRNSVLMLAQFYFSHKELHGKKVPDMHEMLYSKGINWAALPPYLKNGTFVFGKEGDNTLSDFECNFESIKKIIEPLLQEE